MYIVALQHGFRTVALQHGFVQVAIFPHVVGDYLICTYFVAMCEMRLCMLYVCCSTGLLILDLAVCMTIWKKVGYSIYIQL